MTRLDLSDNHVSKFIVFLEIWNDYSSDLVRKRLEIGRKTYNIFFSLAMEEGIRRGKERQVVPKYNPSFSTNEDDYGDLIPYKKIKNKYRKLENLPIKHHTTGEMGVAARRYKNFLKTQEV